MDRPIDHGTARLWPLAAAIAGIACYSVMDGVLKAASLSLGAFAAIFWRSVVGLALLAPAWGRQARWPERRLFLVHVARGVLGAAMAILFFDGVVRMPLAQAIGLSFIAPLQALYLAAVMLGERVHPRAVLGSLVALAGVGIIAASQVEGSHGADGWRGLIEILASATFYATGLVLQRYQAQRASPVEVAFFQNLVVVVVLAPAAALWAPWPDGHAWMLVSVGALLATLSMLAIAWAYARAEAQALVPMEYTAFLWAALVGWIAFAEPVTRATIAGVGLIVLGCVMAVRRGGVPADHLGGPAESA